MRKVPERLVPVLASNAASMIATSAMASHRQPPGERRIACLLPVTAWMLMRLPERRNQSGGPAGIGGIFGKARAEDRLLVANALQLEIDLRRDDDHRFPGRDLDEQAEHAYLLGEIERMAHDGVRPVRHQPTGLGHDAEGASQIEQYDKRQPIAAGDQRRGDEMRRRADLAAGQQNQPVKKIAAEQCRDPRPPAWRFCRWPWPQQGDA